MILLDVYVPNLVNRMYHVILWDSFLLAEHLFKMEKLVVNWILCWRKDLELVNYLLPSIVLL